MPECFWCGDDAEYPIDEAAEIFVCKECRGVDRDPDELVEQINTGASVEGKLKRGTGTRDQDEIIIKGKGGSAEEAIEEFETMLERYENEWSDRMRTIQPGEDDE